MARGLPGEDGRQARLLFVALWNFAEDHGVCRGTARYVAAEVFPHDEDLSISDVERWLLMLERAGRIVRYRREGSTYAWLRGFAEHQKIDRPSKTTFPTPTQAEIDAAPPTDREQPETSGQPGDSASPRRALVAGEDGSGRDGSGKELAVARGAPHPRKVLSDALVAVYLEVREEPYLWGGAKDARAMDRLMGFSTNDEILARWRFGLRALGWKQVNTIAQLAAKWNDITAPDGPLIRGIG